MNEPCKLLDWDTRFFGVRVATINSDHFDDSVATEAIAWCMNERIDCLYLLADLTSVEAITAAERHGFGLKDIRLTYRRQLERTYPAPSLPVDIHIRTSRPDDSKLLEAITEGCYTDSRFYFDQRFPRAKADEMYRDWVRQSVAGQADVVLVMEQAGRAAGFITCHLLDRRTGQCRLGGLDISMRGRGLGQRLYESALHWFAMHGVEEVIYVTQARNLTAQRLFQRLGFLSHSTQLWYHKWFDHAAIKAA